MFCMNRVQTRKPNCVHVVLVCDYDLICVSARFYKTSEIYDLYLLYAHVKEEKNIKLTYP